jgi:hypothetical protein
LREVFALEKQRLSGYACECVREAIAQVEAGRMASFSESAECATRGAEVFERARNGFTLKFVKNELEHGDPVFASATKSHHLSF